MTLALALGEGTLRLNDLKGTVAGASGGRATDRRIAAAAGQPQWRSGDRRAGLGGRARYRRRRSGHGVKRSAGRAVVGRAVQGRVRGVGGQIAIKAGRVPLLPHLAARDFQGTLYLEESQLALRVADARVADGRLAGELIPCATAPE